MIRYLLVYVSLDIPYCTLVPDLSRATPLPLLPRAEYGLNFEYDDDLTSLSRVEVRDILFQKGRQMKCSPDFLGMPRIPEEMLPKLFDHCRQEIYRR